MTTLKPYPEYKDSGQPWLDRIPAHWQLLRIKHLFSERVEKGFPDEPLLAATQSKGVVPKDQYEHRTMLALKDLHLLKLVEEGDYVISLRSFQGGIEYAHYRGIISPAYTVLTPSESVRKGYFQFFFKSSPFIDSLRLFVTGIREGQNIDYSRLSRASLPVPPIEEQAAIGRFLRAKVSKINHYIHAQRRLIELLTEQKQVLIQQAVTRGIDPHVNLKPSGIEWMGKIPENWAIIPLKSLSTIQSGLTLGKNYLGRKLVEYPYLRVANVQDGHLNLSEIKTVFITEEDAARAVLQRGDVLMTEGGDPDKLGRGCVWEEHITPCLHQNHIFAVRPRLDQLRPQYLAALLTAQYAKIYFLRTAKQTTNLASTNRTTIGQLPVLLPNLTEQDEILTFLEARTSPVRMAIDRTERHIDLVREYRTRLIADVVTGKLDVRGVPLPDLDEAGDPGDLDKLEEDVELDNLDAEEMDYAG